MKVLGGVPPGGSTKSESSDVVEENTDVFDVEGLVNDLPAAELRSSQNKEDSVSLEGTNSMHFNRKELKHKS